MEISSIIKYEGNNDVFIWKHPKEDFNTTTQLIVHESQEAILFRNGQALDLFGPGRHTLETENIPLLKKYFNVATNGKTPFHCEIYYINKIHTMDILWGTRNHIPINDVKYNVILPIGANGQFGVRITDSRKCLLKLVGTVKEFSKRNLTQYFRGLLLSRIKDYITSEMVEHNLSFLEIHTHLIEISTSIEKQLKDKFDEYGFELLSFYINSIIVAENDRSFTKLKEALAKKAEMDLLGYSYNQERTFDVLDKAADNEGTSSTIMGTGLGLGMGLNIGNTVGGAMGNAVNKTFTDNQTPPKKLCEKCKAELPHGAKFCMQCGTKIIVNDPSKVTCPECGKQTAKGKFCLHCGSKIIKTCSKCGKDLIAGAKFCLECGEKIND